MVRAYDRDAIYQWYSPALPTATCSGRFSSFSRSNNNGVGRTQEVTGGWHWRHVRRRQQAGIVVLENEGALGAHYLVQVISCTNYAGVLESPTGGST